MKIKTFPPCSYEDAETWVNKYLETIKDKDVVGIQMHLRSPDGRIYMMVITK